MKWPFRRDPDPFAATRYGGLVKSVRERRRRHMRHWWQWALLAFFVLIAVTSGYFAWKYSWANRAIHRGGPGDSVTEREEGEPFNVLLVGSDSREGLTEEEQEAFGANAVGGERADTVILAHVDPAENGLVMVQFPRDLYVELPDRGEEKINGALQYGPDYLVRTIKSLTGLEINQYVQVNISGFRHLVDKIGGVELCIPEPIPFDPKTGIEVPPEEVGMVEFTGERALRFVRSRNFATGDFERIRNQQRFLAAAINKVTSASILGNPGRINGLFDVAAEYVTTDQHTTLLGLRELAKRFRTFDPERYEAYVAPNLGIGASDAGESIVLPNEPAMDLLFEAIARNESPAEYDGVPDVDPGTITVGVYNGTAVDGTAAAAAEQLVEATSDIDSRLTTEVADWKRTGVKETFVRWDPDKPETETMAEFVAAAIPGAEVQEGPLKGVDVGVIVGEAFETEPLIQLLPLTLPTPSATPDVCQP
jgi:LCP family protein required for cell wall assembly